MPSYIDDLDYGNSRVAETVALVDGVPRYIRFLRRNNLGEPSVFYEILGGSDLMEAPITSLNTREMPLGFVNSDRLYYITRVPARQYRQGLRNDNIRDIRFENKYKVGTHIRGLVEAIMGMYPSPEECIEAVECQESTEYAFSRQYAVGSKKIGHSYNLLYKDKSIGDTFKSDGGLIRFELQDEFKFLEESLQEVVENARR